MGLFQVLRTLLLPQEPVSRFIYTPLSKVFQFTIICYQQFIKFQEFVYSH